MATIRTKQTNNPMIAVPKIMIKFTITAFLVEKILNLSPHHKLNPLFNSLFHSFHVFKKDFDTFYALCTGGSEKIGNWKSTFR